MSMDKKTKKLYDTIAQGSAAGKTEVELADGNGVWIAERARLAMAELRKQRIALRAERARRRAS